MTRMPANRPIKLGIITPWLFHYMRAHNLPLAVKTRRQPHSMAPPGYYIHPNTVFSAIINLTNVN